MGGGWAGGSPRAAHQPTAGWSRGSRLDVVFIGRRSCPGGCPAPQHHRQLDPQPAGCSAAPRLGVEVPATVFVVRGHVPAARSVVRSGRNPRPSFPCRRHRRQNTRSATSTSATGSANCGATPTVSAGGLGSTAGTLTSSASTGSAGARQASALWPVRRLSQASVWDQQARAAPLRGGRIRLRQDSRRHRSGSDAGNEGGAGRPWAARVAHRGAQLLAVRWQLVSVSRCTCR